MQWVIRDKWILKGVGNWKSDFWHQHLWSFCALIYSMWSFCAMIYSMLPFLIEMKSIFNSFYALRSSCRIFCVDWLFNVTSNDISVIYVTAHICAGGLKKPLDVRSGSQRHTNIVWFFNVSLRAPTRGQPFYGYSEKPPIFFSCLLGRAWGYGGSIRVSNPQGSHGGRPVGHERRYFNIKPHLIKTDNPRNNFPTFLFFMEIVLISF